MLTTPVDSIEPLFFIGTTTATWRKTVTLTRIYA